MAVKGGPLTGPVASGTINNWVPSTVYGIGQCCVEVGVIYQNQTGSSFTSASTRAADAANWIEVGVTQAQAVGLAVARYRNPAMSRHT